MIKEINSHDCIKQKHHEGCMGDRIGIGDGIALAQDSGPAKLHWSL